MTWISLQLIVSLWPPSFDCLSVRLLARLEISHRPPSIRYSQIFDISLAVSRTLLAIIPSLASYIVSFTPT